MEGNKVLSVEVKAIERMVKEGKDKGKKFLAYKIFNKQKGYYEELRFNKKVNNMPQTEGTFILEVNVDEINRIGLNSRKYPLTWISKINEVVPYEQATFSASEEDLPF